MWTNFDVAKFTISFWHFWGVALSVWILHVLTVKNISRRDKACYLFAQQVVNEALAWAVWNITVATLLWVLVVGIPLVPSVMVLWSSIVVWISIKLYLRCRAVLSCMRLTRN